MLKYKLKKDNTYCLNLDTIGILDIHYLVDDYYKGLPISEVKLSINEFRMTIDMLILGNNVHKLTVDNEKNHYLTIKCLVLGDSLSEFKFARILRVHKIEIRNNKNYELIGGYLFNKQTSSIDLALDDNNLTLPDDPRIKCLNYYCTNEFQAGNIFVSKYIKHITSRLFESFYTYFVYIDEGNTNYVIKEGCLIDIKEDALLKQLENKPLPKNLFSNIRGKFTFTYNDEDDDIFSLNNDEIPEYDDVIIPNNVKCIKECDVLIADGVLTLPKGLEIPNRMLVSAYYVNLRNVKNPENLEIHASYLETNIDMYNNIKKNTGIKNLRLTDNSKRIKREVDSFVTFTRLGRYSANKDYMIDNKTKTLIYYNYNTEVKERFDHVLDTAFKNFREPVLILPHGIRTLTLVNFDREYLSDLNGYDDLKIICNEELESLEGEIPSNVKLLYLNKNLKHIAKNFFKPYSDLQVDVSKENEHFKTNGCTLFQINNQKEIAHNVNDLFLEVMDLKEDECIEVNRQIMIHKKYNGPLKDIIMEPVISRRNKHFRFDGNFLVKDNEAKILEGLTLPTDSRIDTILGLCCPNIYLTRGLKDLSRITIPKNIKNIDGLLEDLERKSDIHNLNVDPDNPYLKKIDGCLIDIINHRLLTVDDEFSIPKDGSITSVRYSPGLHFNYAVFPAFCEIDERFKQQYKIFLTDNKIVLTLRKRKVNGLDKRLYY